MHLLCFVSFIALASGARDPILVDGAFIIELSDHAAVENGIDSYNLDRHAEFHKRAEVLPFEYTVAHEYRSPGAYVGLSIRVAGDGDPDTVLAQLEAVPGVLSVSPVYEMFLSDPNIPDNSTGIANPFLSYADPPAMPGVVPKPGESLTSTLEMAGVDKLHQLGIKGKGVKIGIVDTGVDYRHPALGGGFGPDFKIAGGWSWLADNGTAVESDDFLTTCYGGGHGTHVAGRYHASSFILFN